MSVQPAPDATPGKLSKSTVYRRIFTVVLLVSGGALLCWGGSLLLQRQKYVAHTTIVAAKSTVTASTDHPEEGPARCDTTQFAADQPREITITAIAASGCVQRVGLDQQNRIATPNNVTVAGWYVNSVAPGDKGVSLIDGHVQGYYNPGIFKKLEALRAGDSITIVRGDGRALSFKVVRRQAYPAAEAAQHMLAVEPGVTNQLNLITCGGRYNPQLKSYELRTIIVAALADR